MIDKYGLLELFESEPKVFGDEEAGMYEYQQKNEYGFTFKLGLFLYDEYCSISLYFKEFRTPIFALSFKNVDKIECKDNKLIIQQEANPKNIVVYFKPNYALVFEERI